MTSSTRCSDWCPASKAVARPYARQRRDTLMYSHLAGRAAWMVWYSGHRTSGYLNRADIATWRLAEYAPILSRELLDAFIAHSECCRSDSCTICQHDSPRFNEPQLLLELER